MTGEVKVETEEGEMYGEVKRLQCFGTWHPWEILVKHRGSVQATKI